jgi:putative ABC transport system permease protein
MELLSGLKVASRSMGRYPLRTFFMMLGIVLGIASLTILLSVGESTKRETIKRFKRMLGTFDTVIVRPGGGRMRGMVSLANVPATLKFEDAAAIAAGIPEIKQVCQVQNAFDIEVKYRDRTVTPGIFGVTSNWLNITQGTVESGEFVSDDDNKAMARVAVIGADVRTELFGNETPLGKTLRIGDVTFQVKGVLASRGAGPGGANLDNIVIMPVTTASRRLFNRDFLTMAIAQLRNPEQSDLATKKVTALLRERHHIPASALDDFNVTNPRASMAQVTQVTSTLSKILMGTAVIAMIIGGVVIMNLMLIAVAERRKEIGVRRSVGASRRDILLQFIIEAIAVSGCGGLVGIGLGVAGSFAATKIQKLPGTVAWNVMGIAVILSISVGVVFGLYPAWKAARVDPIAALRS